jgi:DNA (cytosine-5)-methyltransferase 1
MLLKVVDLFSGVGGFAYGFKKAGGFHTVFANDVDSDMCKAFSLNFPEIKVICKSIAELDFSEILGGSSVDVLIGGPPCQAYSTSGKRMLEDPRASLYKQYYRALVEIQPKLFIYENVRGLLSIAGGQLFEELTQLFSSLGYQVQAKVLNAVDYGVPQERDRVIVVGVKDSIKFSFPIPTHSSPDSCDVDLFKSDLLPYVSLGEAIGDLPPITANSSALKYLIDPQNEYQRSMRRGSTELLHDHNSPAHGEALMKVISALPEGGRKDDLPDHIKPKSGFPNSYGRLWWDRPSTTITRNLGTPSSARCVHPRCDRALTTREGARLQSFPDSFLFYGARAKKNLQIGNAVPPLLAEVLAQRVRAAFFGST